MTCDTSKAFDRAWHTCFIFKLKYTRVSGLLLSWFSDYLNDRKQRVVLPGTKSSLTSVLTGVPQSSTIDMKRDFKVKGQCHFYKKFGTMIAYGVNITTKMGLYATKPVFRVYLKSETQISLFSYRDYLEK